ncbi:DUF4157 domain-containing protein [Streptomyces sp. Caat 7-52]|uniref:eCIS core domain-containing protein n=1 Tax=Streptomyces sp. Caat 7-52 TaxID=2949637 RepID=UPI002035F32C|nr:DUF4157 domain-containing protein [Streptomyces sp. Caat 7-52]
MSGHPGERSPAPRRARPPDETRAERAADEALRGGRARAGEQAGLPEHVGECRTAGEGHLPRTGGEPLDPDTRKEMEAAFGHDFGQVRIHDDAAADRVAHAEGAVAFTAGEHIVLGAGRGDPGTARGRRLLAHELAHVAQQRAARSVLVQHQDQEQEDRPDAEPPPVRMMFSVKVDRPLDPDRLLLEFIKQYRNVPSDAEARKVRAREHWRWIGQPQRASAADAARGYVLLTVRDQSLRATPQKERVRLTGILAGLGDAERAALDTEADRLVRERTHYAPSPGSGPLAQDPAVAEYREEVRYELLRRREALQALPDDVRAILFSGQVTAQSTPPDPRDYARLLALADRLTALTPQQREEFLHRSTVQTPDLDAFEGSLRRFEEETAERRRLEAEQSTLANHLMGLEKVYARYRQLIVAETISPTGALLLGPYGIREGEKQRTEARVELEEELKQHDFAGIAEFTKMIRAYEKVFREQACALGHVLLERYEHTLVEQEHRVATTPVATEIHQRLAPARVAYTQAAALEGRLAHEHREQAEELVKKEAAQLPVLAQKSFDRRAFAEGSQEAAPGRVRDYIAARRADIARCHQLLRTEPDRVFRLDALLKHAYTAQGIEADSIFDHIIRDHALDIALKDADTQLMVGVFAIALGAVSGGGGAVGVLAASGAFTLSAYQAFEEFRRYEESKALHEGGLLSDDPSIAWAVVALVGAGLDLAGVAAALRAANTEGVTVAKAVRTFHETEDAARFAREVAHADPTVRAALDKAAEARSAALAAWGRVVRPTSVHASLFVIDVLIPPLIEAMWLTQLYGVRRFQAFLRTREATKLLGVQFMALPPEARAGVRKLYEDVSQVVRRGETLGLRPDEIDHIMLSWAERPGTPVTTVLAEMNTYAGPLGGSRTARHRIAPESVLDEATRRLLPEYDWRIASTGGIRSIRASLNPKRARVVTIEGVLKPSLARSASRAGPDQLVAPNFNATAKLFSGRDLGLARPEEWQLLHLWGPGFGDEAAAGIMLGPRAVNQEWQNRGVEQFIRDLRDQASRQAGQVRVRATAVAWERPTPTTRYRSAEGVDFLKEARYEITLELPGKPTATTTISLHTAEPPASALSKDGIHLVNAAGRRVDSFL